MKLDIKLDTQGIVKKVDKIANKDQVRSFLASEVLREMNQYTPKDTGTLISTAYSEVGLIIYPQPYARKVYYGLGGIQIHTDQNRNATTHWDKTMMAAKRDKIAKAVSNYIKKL